MNKPRQTPHRRHSRAGGNPSEILRNRCLKTVAEIQKWIPTCAGMTVVGQKFIPRRVACPSPVTLILPPFSSKSSLLTCLPLLYFTKTVGPPSSYCRQRCICFGIRPVGGRLKRFDECEGRLKTRF